MISFLNRLSNLLKFEFRYRLLVLIGGISGFIAYMSFSSDTFLRYFEEAFYIKLQSTPIPIVLLAFAVTSFSLFYLQSGGSKFSDDINADDIKKIYHELLITKKEIDKERELFKYIQNKIEKNQHDFNHEEKQKIIDDAVSKISKESIKDIFRKETDNLEDKIKENLSFERLLESSRSSMHRLYREISDLRLRANINLIIGMLITSAGLYLLWSTVSLIDASDLLKHLASEGSDSNDKFFKSLILPIVPRILLVIFIEVFAYFFLRLYKAGLSEIKYFQNELTNIESKVTAVEFSYMSDNQDSLRFAIEALSKTERNFVLERGQTTVELEQAKSESELTRTLIKSIPTLFKGVNKS